MTEKVHDQEPDTSERVVRQLLKAERPDLADAPLSYLRSSGTSNAVWRVHPASGIDLVVRLPRSASAENGLRNESAVLPWLAETDLSEVVAVPSVRHVGAPTKEFPFQWAIYGWIDGADAWQQKAVVDLRADDMATEVAQAVHAISSLEGAPAPARQTGDRGGPLRELFDSLERVVDQAQGRSGSLIDATAVRRVIDECREVEDMHVESRFVHGDLIPGNLLLRNDSLAAIVDWGAAAFADPAQDLAPAWAVFEGRSREVFRQALGVDDATWLRGKAFELQHAVVGLLYYRPRGNQLADVMERTLLRILEA